MKLTAIAASDQQADPPNGPSAAKRRSEQPPLLARGKAVSVESTPNTGSNGTVALWTVNFLLLDVTVTPTPPSDLPEALPVRIHLAAKPPNFGERQAEAEGWYYPGSVFRATTVRVPELGLVLSYVRRNWLPLVIFMIIFAAIFITIFTIGS